MARILTAYIFSGVQRGYVLLYQYWFFCSFAKLCHYVDKVSVASSHFLCDLGWKMRLLWHDLIPQCSFQACSVLQIPSKRKRLLQADTEILAFSRMGDEPLESRNLLFSISFQRPWQCCRESMVFSMFDTSWICSLRAFSSLPEHLGAVDICLMRSVSPPVMVLILHSGQAGWQAARLIMIDSEIRELILK